MAGALFTNNHKMDWPKYKLLADTPGVWSRWMLEQTLELLQHPQLVSNANRCLNQRIVVQLQACLAQAPIPKPPDYKGGSSLDMFRLQLEQTHAQALLALVRQATELDITTTETAKRGLGGFVAAWQEYLSSIHP